MASSGLKLDIRRSDILDILAKEGKIRVSQLSHELNVSEVTIRNDLAELENDGYLERVPGGAILTTKNYYNLDAQKRKKNNSQIKQAIAAKTASLIEDGETLMINSGSTAYYTAVELKRRKNLNVVTNSISIAMELGAYPTFRVVLLGGEINPQYSFTYGNDALNQLEKYKANKVVLSVDGICPGAGLTTYHAEEAEIIKQMIVRSHQCIVVADANKIGKESFSNIGALSFLDVLVTNADQAPQDVIAAIRQTKVKIQSVQEGT